MASIFQDLRSPVRPSQVASPRSRKGPPPLSSPLSLRTARVATPSSQPKIAPINFTLEKEPKETQKYRSAKSLPYELRHHCLVYFEEQLYTSALNLLNNIVTSGTSFPLPAGPAFAPPPSHLALTNTLLVHPLHTTRASSDERLEVSSEALLLLQTVLATLGPVNANLGEAFTFSSAQSVSLRQGRRSNGIDRKSAASKTSEDDEDGLAIMTSLADNSSLWRRAQDFWHVVGWAFNCSVKYPRRWQYWRVWLDYMLNVLDADWKERCRMDDKSNEEKRKQNPHEKPMQTFLQDSLLLSYLAGQGRSSATIRRVVRSVFADGSEENLRIFPEVFDKETRERIAKDGFQRENDLPVDIEKDNYGDYAGDENDGEGDPMDLTPDSSSRERVLSCICGDSGLVNDKIRSISCENCGVWQHSKCLGIKRSAAEADNFHFICETCKDPDVEMDGGNSAPTTIMGGPEAVVLRLRLIALLSQACHTYPDHFTSNPELYPMFFEYISALPLPAFSLFVSPTPHLLNTALSSLVQVLLIRLLPNSTPTPDNDEISQEILETCYLPFTASTSSIEDNAKVSILVETLFRLFIAACPMTATPSLTTAIEKGIEARQARTIDKRRKKAVGAKAKDEAAQRFWLDSSAERLRNLLHFIKIKGPALKHR